MRLAEDSSHANAAAQARYNEIDVIIKCLDAAVANLEISIKQIEPKYNDLKKWVVPALSEHEQLVTRWEHYLSIARNVSVSPAIVKFMTRGEVNKPRPTLEDLVELDTARKAGKLAPTAHRRFSDKANELEKAAARMYQRLEGLIGEFDTLMNRSALGHSTDSAQLLEDIEAVAKQIDSDYRTSLGYSGSQKDVAQASKTASVHTERLIPTLRKRAKDMDEMVQYATQARNSIAAESVTFMRSITEITSLHSSVKNQINILNQSEDDMTTFDYLRLIHQLPYMYASFLAEAVRRREWVDKVKSDSSTLANEMALFQDEESKRRRKWQKMIGSMYGPGLDTNVIGLEVNLLGEDNPWPAATKEELEEFVRTLDGLETDQSIVNDILKLIEELNNPTKQQLKRLKAFKNGSVHEAALGRSGLMIRGDDEVLRSLQYDKTKIENKLRTAESRVRRLEDLLHRQSQASRPSSLFQPQSPQLQDRHDSSSSIKSARIEDRRPSPDEADATTRRIAQLENELREEKQRSAKFEKDFNDQCARHDDMKGQIDEVNSTKKDLLQNMEAFKREFMEERKSLEDEVRTLRARLEETEDEMFNFDESRQNEKAAYVEKAEALEAEIKKLSSDRQDEVLKAQGQVEFLRKETRMQREQGEALERQLQAAQNENRTLEQKLRVAKEAAESQLETLQALYLQFKPSESLPDNLLDLGDSLSALTAELLAATENKEKDISLLKTDLEQANTLIKELRSERSKIQEQLSTEEMAAVHLRENLSEEKAKVTALEAELVDGRDQLKSLRAKLMDGETGSESLQKRIEEEEKKVADLSEELASRQSQAGSLDEELRMFREKIDDLQGKITHQTANHQIRDERTKDLTQRLYSQNDRLTRLLERVGFSVSRAGGDMTINKIPRSERTSQNPNDSSDPGSSLRKSTMLNSRTLTDSTDLEMLYWINDADPELESEKYDKFMSTLGHFDIDLFSETIYRRVKEVEHLARKWQRESRAYREKAHTAQKDSNEKIAFRHFKEGDLALFLPTRNQQAGAWAAFNVGFPHYFLREQDAHRLRHREWLVARIARIQERVVDLSKSMQPSNETDSMNDEENDNPFQLSDGLRWYLIDAHEDKPGAPSTPGMGKSTVAANTVEATANIHTHIAKGKGKNRDSVASIEGINKSLSKSLDSRRSSSGSKKALPFQLGGGTALLKNSALASETNSLRAVATESPSGTSPPQGGLQTTANASQSPNQAAERKDKAADGKRTDERRATQPSGSSRGGSPAKRTEVRNVDSLLGP